jgi:hypothetical protein
MTAEYARLKGETDHNVLPNVGRSLPDQAFNATQVMRVNSTNVQDEGLRIGGIGRWMNSKVRISQIMRVSRINMVINLAYSQSVPNRPLLAPIYRWPGLKEPVGFDTYYNVYIRHGLILQL